MLIVPPYTQDYLHLLVWQYSFGMQLLMYEVRLVEQGLLSGGLSGWGAVYFQGLRLSSRYARQSVAALTVV